MWKSTEFIVLPHRDSKDVFILGGTDDIQVLLDDSQVSRERKGERRRGGERQKGEEGEKGRREKRGRKAEGRRDQANTVFTLANLFVLTQPSLSLCM